jgi:hypothetical protein
MIDERRHVPCAGFDKLSPNGLGGAPTTPIALSLSKGPCILSLPKDRC